MPILLTLWSFRKAIFIGLIGFGLVFGWLYIKNLHSQLATSKAELEQVTAINKENAVQLKDLNKRIEKANELTKKLLAKDKTIKESAQKLRDLIKKIPGQSCAISDKILTAIKAELDK